jgi:hypothetical protein
MPKRDWRNKADYQFTKDLDLNGWAWEFLRRNPEYQKDWKKELNHFLHKNPSLTKKEIDDDCFYIEPALIDCNEKWWILRFVNPDTDYPLFLDFANSHGCVYSKTQNVELLPGQVAAVFDLNLPIKRQIDLIALRLPLWQKEYKRKGIVKRRQPRIKDFCRPSYLRLLDAKADSADNKEINSVIFKNKRQHPDDSKYYNTVIKDAMRTVKKIVDGGYRDLITGP